MEERVGRRRGPGRTGREWGATSNSVRWVRSVAKWGRIMYVRKLTVELLLGSALIAKTGRAIKIRGLLALRLWGER